MHESKALVMMIDEASDPLTNVAEMLISVGYAALATSAFHQPEETTTAAEVCGRNCMTKIRVGR